MSCGKAKEFRDPLGSKGKAIVFLRREDMARILLLTGDGKGKTTAALGLAIRALGHGLRVCISQFLKKDAEVGEYRFLSSLPSITIRQWGRGYLPSPDHPSWKEHCQAAEEGWEWTEKALLSREYDLYLLDELALALSKGLLSGERVFRALSTLSPEAIVVITGRSAPPCLYEWADTVTEMRDVKHAFEKGLPPQRGVER